MPQIVACVDGILGQKRTSSTVLEKEWGAKANNSRHVGPYEVCFVDLLEAKACEALT